MASRGRTATVERLRARIAAIEQRPALPEMPAAPHGWNEAAFLAAPAGLLHEVFSDGIRDAGAALGFALGQAGRLIGPSRPAMLFAQLAAEGQETGLPFGPGLNSWGIDPERLAIVRTGHLAELLWAMEEAVACRAVAAVVADMACPRKGPDFTASRRLSLRAKAAGASVLMVRYGAGREASAAQLRWHVRPAASGPPAFDPMAPGAARFAITLEKGVVRDGRAGDRWLIEWTGHGFRDIDTRHGDPRAAPGAAVHGAASAGMGHGLPQAGRAGPRRAQGAARAL